MTISKNEQFHYLLSNLSKLSHRNQQLGKTGMNKAQRLCKTLNEEGIQIPIFDTYEKIKTFFTNEIGLCECGKMTKLRNDNLNNPFLKYCSEKCEYLAISKRQSGENNSCHKFDKKKWKENLSKALKKSIAEGKFTPNITNSWCHSRRVFEMNGRIHKVRSSWEENFWRKNPHFEYETIRIPYKDIEGKSHSYIVDFLDRENKILYEIKPSSRDFLNSIKHRAALKWCEENGFKFEIIDEANL